MFRRGFEEIALRPNGQCGRGDQFFPNRIDRRVRHLGEELFEIVVEQLGFVGQYRQWCVGTHRTNWLDTIGGHRANIDA